MRAVVIFDNLGPYHLARLRAASEVNELGIIQITAQSAEYAWINEFQADGFKLQTLFPNGTSRRVQKDGLKQKLEAALATSCPQVVFIPGWSSKAAFVALQWCLRQGVPAVAMSESTEQDEKRTVWKEWIKRRLVSLFSSALAGGAPQKNYLAKLNMPTDRVFLGYDAVDNDYFGRSAKVVRDNLDELRRKYELPKRYFLASSRFIEKKNIPRLLQAYARYRALAQTSDAWDLVLLGDGELRPIINGQISTLNLGDSVHLPGFRQYPDLPAYYALAGAFIHASTSEQWGLVVNEAMASSLPVLVSNRCGCAADLVQENINGFTFDPHEVETLANLMLKLSALGFPLSDFGAASTRIIANWGPDRFARGLQAAAQKAIEIGPKQLSFLDRLLLSILILR